MPPLERTQQLLNKPFKQRKSFGKDTWAGGLSEPEAGPRPVGLSLTVCVCPPARAATRKQEVVGIRTKFPNKIPVS